MKVLVLTITAGGGHNSTAQAVRRGLEALGIECEVLDAYYYLSKVLGDTVSGGYHFAVKSAYRTVYRQLEQRKSNSFKMSPTRLTNMALAQKLRKFTDEYDPDVIVCTHIFAGIMVDIMKQLGETRAKTIGILTDFSFHPYWEEALRFDYVVTPSELLLDKALKKGFREDQILPYGIPIDPKFAVEIPREEAARASGLDPDMKTLLYMSGSMGHGDIVKTVRAIDESEFDFQTVVVTGNNAHALKKLKRMKLKKKFTLLGFTDKVDVLMSAADIIITKPGGLTTSESLARRLPMILDDPIPGHEDRNTEFLLNFGAAMLITDTFPIDEILYVIFNFPRRLELMRKSIELIRKPDSTATLCEFIAELDVKAAAPTPTPKEKFTAAFKSLKSASSSKPASTSEALKPDKDNKK